MEDRILKFKFILLLVAITGMAACNSCTHAKRASSPALMPAGNAVKNESEISAVQPAKQQVDFDTDLRPIFASRCQPCHFPGGKVYAQLPFDRPETIRQLGARLFSRIKDEGERTLIRNFLGADADSTSSAAEIAIDKKI